MKIPGYDLFQETPGYYVNPTTRLAWESMRQNGLEINEDAIKLMEGLRALLNKGKP